MTVWHWIVVNHVIVWTTIILVLKWAYNAGAFQAGVTFKQFLRGFIGEVIQEAPPPPLTPAQQKALAEAGVPEPHV